MRERGQIQVIVLANLALLIRSQLMDRPVLHVILGNKIDQIRKHVRPAQEIQLQLVAHNVYLVLRLNRLLMLERLHALLAMQANSQMGEIHIAKLVQETPPQLTVKIVCLVLTLNKLQIQ